MVSVRVRQGRDIGKSNPQAVSKKLPRKAFGLGFTLADGETDPSTDRQKGK